MAARSRRRTSRMREADTVNAGSPKGAALQAVELADVLCCVCRGVLVEPVSLPCRHRFCRTCWLATDALRCLLCRKRVGSWLRESTRRNHLVDEDLWRIIRDKFPDELANKRNGIDVVLPDDCLAPRLCAPGEIRAEYEAELERLRAERLREEQAQQRDAQLLAQKLQREEEEAHKAYLEKLKQDEELAKQLQESENSSHASRPNGTVRPATTHKQNKHTKYPTIDRYLVKKPAKEIEPSPLITDDETNSSSASSVSKNEAPVPPPADLSQPAPSYGHFLKDYLDKKLRHLTGSMLDKDATNTVKTWVPPSDSKDANAQKEFSFGSSKVPLRTKGAQKELCPVVASSNTGQSVPVSLPYTGILNRSVVTMASRHQHKHAAVNRDSVDSIRKELCFFKPITTGSIARSKQEWSEVIRVPAVRATPPTAARCPPARAPDYLHGLSLLRGGPGPRGPDAPSAFACLVILQVDEAACDISEVKMKADETVRTSLGDNPPGGRDPSFREKLSDDHESTVKSQSLQRLRRTRSTGNIPKLVEESISKKYTPRKKRATPGRKRKSKSEGKKPDAGVNPVDFKRLNSVSKNLSSPIEMCDAISNKKSKKEPSGDCGYVESNNNHFGPRKTPRRTSAAYMNGNGHATERTSADSSPTEHKRREQERRDLELALRVHAEWNGGYALRRAPAKRLHPLQHPLVLPKKMKA